MIKGINDKVPEDDKVLIPESGSEDGVVRIYRLYREEFFQWARMHYKMEEDGCADVFQEAVLRLFLQSRKGKLKELNCSLKTYLFAIGKNIIMKSLSKQKVAELHAEQIIKEKEQKHYLPEEEPVSNRQKVVMQVLEDFAEPCKSILRLFYFKSCSMADIAKELKYKNEHVVKSQKVRCMSELKRQVKEILKRY